MTRRIGFELLKKVRELDPDFQPGPPWTEKETIVVECGYSRTARNSKLIPQFGEFHEAYEDARLFQEIFSEELEDSSEDPQELFCAFTYVREETLFLDDLIEQLRAFGIDYIIELQDEIMEYEVRCCSGPEDI